MVATIVNRRRKAATTDFAKRLSTLTQVTAPNTDPSRKFKSREVWLQSPLKKLRMAEYAMVPAIVHTATENRWKNVDHAARTGRGNAITNPTIAMRSPLSCGAMVNTTL